ncbi:MAG: AAA family ATPase, partial [Byssovorax sp.]
MLTGVKIENFRGVSEGGVEGLAPISILVGPNNSGKSTVLEAIAALGLGVNAKEVAGFLTRRGGPPLDALARVIGRSAKQATISANGSFDARESWSTSFTLDKDKDLFHYDQAVRMVQVPNEGLVGPTSRFTIKLSDEAGAGAVGMTYMDFQGGRSSTFTQQGNTPDALFQTSFVDVEAVRTSGALEDAYTRLDEAGQLSKVVKSLSRSMPGLADLRILKVGTDFVLHTFFESGPPVPAYLAGDGFKRFLELAAAAVGTPDGVVLLEEPESFQHPRYLQELATLLHLAAKEGTQIILSTHSIELIDLLLHAPAAEGQTYPAVHRMRIFDGKL